MFIRLRIHSSPVHHPALIGAPPDLQRALGVPQPSLNRLGASGFHAWCVRVQEGSGDPQGCQNALGGDQERPGGPMQQAEPVDSGVMLPFPQALSVLPEPAPLGTRTPKPGQSLREYFLSM